MKQSITPAEHLQLQGLYALADRYRDKEREVLDAAWELLALDDDSSDEADHIADAVYNDSGRASLLERLGIRVEEAPVEEENSRWQPVPPR